MELVNLATNHTIKVLQNDYTKKGSYITAHLECVEMRKNVYPQRYRNLNASDGLKSYILECLTELYNMVNEICDIIETVDTDNLSSMCDFLNAYNAFKLDYIDVSHKIKCSLEEIRDDFGITEKEVINIWKKILKNK